VEVINFLCVGANKNFNKMLLCDIAFKWKSEGAADYETLSLQVLKLIEANGKKMFQLHRREVEVYLCI
jgi:hypothetical protein